MSDTQYTRCTCECFAKHERWPARHCCTQTCHLDVHVGSLGDAQKQEAHQVAVARAQADERHAVHGVHVARPLVGVVALRHAVVPGLSVRPQCICLHGPLALAHL